MYIYSRYDTRKICIKHNVYEVGHDILTVKSRKKFGTNNGGGGKKVFLQSITDHIPERPSYYIILYFIMIVIIILNTTFTPHVVMADTVRCNLRIYMHSVHCTHTHTHLRLEDENPSCSIERKFYVQ